MTTAAKKAKDVREAAQRYSDEALELLAGIMRAGSSEAAQIAAARELLDRAHGKPRTPDDGPGGLTFAELVQKSLQRDKP